MARTRLVFAKTVTYYEGPDMPDRRRLVVPKHLRDKVMEEHHSGPFLGHFAAKRMTKRVSQYFFWVGMRGDRNVRHV